MVLAEGRFLDGQRAPEERLGPDGVSPKQVMGAEQDQTPGDVWMGATTTTTNPPRTRHMSFSNPCPWTPPCCRVLRAVLRERLPTENWRTS